MNKQSLLQKIGKSMWLFLAIIAMSFSAWGQALLTEHFEYGASNINLLDATGVEWTCTPTCSSTNPIAYVAGQNLSVGSYPQLGGLASFTTTGQDINRTFTNQTTGAVYASFLMNITSAQTAGDYFFHLGPNPISTSFHTRVFVKSSGSGFEIGIQKGSTTPPTYNSTVYSFNTSYLVVVKYQFNTTTTTDDVTSLYIFNANAPATEPATAMAENNAGNDFTGVGAIAIRQGTASNAPAGSIDYIRVGTTWGSVTSVPMGAVFSLAQGSTSIANNNTPAFNLGTTLINTNLDVTFTITNAGSASLNITTPISVSGAGYTIQTQPSATVGFAAPNNSTTFVVRFNSATAVSNATGTVTIQHNATGSPFTLNLTATATATATPTIVVAQGTTTIANNNSPAFNMGSVSVSNNLDVTFTITNNGTANLTLTTPIGISGAGYTIQTQPAATVGFAAPNNSTTFVVRFNSANPVNNAVGTVTIQNNAGPDFVINLVATANVALSTYTETFNTACFGSFTTFSVSGDQSWQCVNFGINPTNSPMAQMNGFAFGASRDNQDWLISPLITVTAGSVLSFWTQVTFTGQNLSIRVSEDYTEGNPSSATWVNVTSQASPVLPTASGSTPSAWVQSFINLSAYANKAIKIAFVYTSEATGNAARWSVEDVMVTNAQFFIYTSVQQLPNLINTTTSQQNYRIISNGVSSVTVTPTGTGIEISKTNSTGFGTTALTFNSAELVNNPQVFVRYRPSTASKQVVLGNIANTIGTKTLNVSVRALDKSQTLDLVTFNTFWFSVSTGNGGTTELGVADNALQVENLKQAILLLDADVYALQEVGNDNIGGGVRGFDKLAADLAPLGYTAIRSPHPDVFNPTDDPGKIQRLGFVYRTSMLSNVRTRVMIQGAAVPSDYPGTSGRFFSGLRFPWLMTADVTFGSNTRRVNFVNFHARANGTESTTDQLYAMRRYDVNILKDTLDNRFNAENVILMGDFNDELNFTIARGIQTPAFQNTTESSWKSFVDDTQGYSAPTRNLSANGFISFLGGAYAIDHIMLSNELAGTLIANSPISENMLPLINNYRNTLSDHLPVSLSLDWAITPSTNPGQFTTSATNLDFGDVATGQNRELTYTLSGSNITGNVVISSNSGFFQIARGSGAFASTISIPAADLASPQVIRVRFAPTSGNAGTRTATLLHTANSGAVSPRTISLTGNETTQATALEEWLERSVQIYPNPATENLQIKVEKNNIIQVPNIQLVNAEGKIIFEKNLAESTQNFETTLNIANFTKGIYLIKVSVGKATVIRKVFIK